MPQLMTYQYLLHIIFTAGNNKYELQK